MTLRRRLAWFHALVLALSLSAFAGVMYAIIEAEEDAEPPVVKVLEPPEQLGERLLIALLCALPVALVVAVGGALLIARRGLAPLEEVVTTAEQIGAENLSARIATPPEKNADEVGRLVTAFNAMLQRLEQSVNGMRRFTADASHELRTPLAALLGELELALTRPRTEEELRAALADTREELGRLSRLTESLLMLARADASGLPMKPEDLDLAAVAQETAEPYRVLRAIDCRGHGRAKTDPLWVGRILANLVDNACKFSTGEIVVEVGDAWLEVRDQGPGIADGERVFERFFRGSTARAESQGFGLGLPLAREIARAIGGELRLLPSETGARFRLELAKQY